MIYIKKYWVHFLFWIIIITGYYFFFINKDSVFKTTDYFIQSFLNIIIFYANIYLLNIWFREKRKPGFYYILIVPFILFTIILKILFEILTKIIFNFDFIHTTSIDIVYRNFTLSLFFIITSILFKLFSDWKTNEKIKQKLYTEKIIAELNQLKTQVNPHFLFNTLNNLYYLTLKKSDNAPKMVMKLSDLMRYVVSVSNIEIVLLEEELINLNNYIDLEMLRLVNPSCITYKINGNPKNLKIAPLLLIPFVENAFKHSKEKISEGLKVIIEIKGKEIKMNVQNHFERKAVKKNTGSGLENVRRRLDLLYPGNYYLNISKNSGIFHVELKINLNDNPMYSS